MWNTLPGSENVSVGKKEIKYFLHDIHMLVIKNWNYHMVISSKKKNMINNEKKEGWCIFNCVFGKGFSDKIILNIDLKTQSLWIMIKEVAMQKEQWM